MFCRIPDDGQSPKTDWFRLQYTIIRTNLNLLTQFYFCMTHEVISWRHDTLPLVRFRILENPVVEPESSSPCPQIPFETSSSQLSTQHISVRYIFIYVLRFNPWSPKWPSMRFCNKNCIFLGVVMRAICRRYVDFPDMSTVTVIMLYLLHALTTLLISMCAVHMRVGRTWFYWTYNCVGLYYYIAIYTKQII
jgi:hypothetical protein